VLSLINLLSPDQHPAAARSANTLTSGAAAWLVSASYPAPTRRPFPRRVLRRPLEEASRCENMNLHEIGSPAATASLALDLTFALGTDLIRPQVAGEEPRISGLATLPTMCASLGVTTQKQVAPT